VTGCWVVGLDGDKAMRPQFGGGDFGSAPKIVQLQVGGGGGAFSTGFDRHYARLVRWGVLALALNQGGT
jgi:hypothetical protein